MSSKSFFSFPLIEGIAIVYKEQASAAEALLAVRNEQGSISYAQKQPAQESVADKIPLLRGILAFFRGISLWNSSLLWSAETAAYAEDRKLGLGRTGFSLLGSLLLALLMFICLPVLLVGVGAAALPAFPWFIVAGLLQMGLFVLYLKIISRLNDIRRVSAYNAAGAMLLNAADAGVVISAETVAAASAQRRGQLLGFLLSTLLLTIFCCAFVSLPQFWLRLLVNLLIFLGAAALCYEINRASGKSENALLRLLSTPGMWLQKMFLCPPDEDIIELVIAALQAADDPELAAELVSQSAAQQEKAADLAKAQAKSARKWAKEQHFSQLAERPLSPAEKQAALQQAKEQLLAEEKAALAAHLAADEQTLQQTTVFAAQRSASAYAEQTMQTIVLPRKAAADELQDELQADEPQLAANAGTGIRQGFSKLGAGISSAAGKIRSSRFAGKLALAIHGEPAPKESSYAPLQAGEISQAAPNEAES